MTRILPKSKRDLMLPPEQSSAIWLTAAQQAIADDAGHALHKEFFRLFSEDAADKGTAVKQAMALLESLWDHDQLVAGYLMALLVGEASSSYRHDVADAVWLYLENASDERLADALERVTVKRGGAASKFARVVQRIRAKHPCR